MWALNTRGEPNEIEWTIGVLTSCFPAPLQANDRLKLACEYLDLCYKYPSATLSTMVFHVRRICKEELTKYQLLEQCCASKNQQELLDVLKECRGYKDGKVAFVFDVQREERARQALEDRKREQNKRKTFEERMIRKAKREDKEPSFYLDKVGRNGPPPQSPCGVCMGHPCRPVSCGWHKGIGAALTMCCEAGSTRSFGSAPLSSPVRLGTTPPCHTHTHSFLLRVRGLSLSLSHCLSFPTASFFSLCRVPPHRHPRT